MSRHGLTIVAMIAFAATPAAAKKKPAMTPMEMQALQSREYQTSKDQVFASVVSVFQDLGYQIGSADMASGLVTASSATKNKTGLLEAFAGMSASGNTRVTAFVEQMPSGMTRIRLNFLNSKNTSSAYGRQSSDDKIIIEPATYQVAFERIEQALFERNALTKTSTPVQPTVEVPVTSKLSISAPPAQTSASASTAASAPAK